MRSRETTVESARNALTLVMFMVWLCRNDKVPPRRIEGEIPMQIPRTIREVIEKGPFAHLTTLNPNGSPQVTVVWVGIEGEEFVMGHLAMHQKVKNIRRDPRVALSFLGYNTTQGMREYVVVYGNARVTEGGAAPLLQRLAPIYLGPGAEYPPASMRNIAGYVTRVTPTRFSGIGPWVQSAAG
jgi:PPOX class probable F420-dependent enzyme